MKFWRLFELPVVCASLILTLTFWLAVSWPLPLHVSDAIPSSAQNVEDPEWREGIAGDHLQLLYYYELLKNMLTGRTPWFHNVYEFNLEGDASRSQPGAYFFPFSLIYSILTATVSAAAAWNIVQWGSVWISALYGWLWLRCFTRDPWSIFLGVTVLVGLPFRWFCLFHGSPTGAALMWLPMAGYGLYQAVVHPTYWRGAMLGMVYAFAYFSDIHVFYFLALSTPLYVGIALATTDRSIPFSSWYRLIPFGVLWAGIIVAYHLWRQHYLADSVSSAPRSLAEIGIYSPLTEYFLHPLASGHYHKVYLGWSLCLALLMGCVFLFMACRKAGRSEWPLLLSFMVVGGVMVTGLVLSTGTRAIDGGSLYNLAREYVPYFAILRQPSKIFIALGPWFAWLVAVGWTRAPLHSYPILRRLMIIMLAALYMVECARAIQPTLAVVPSPDPAYEAVKRNIDPDPPDERKVIVLPIWPGDSAPTSYPMFLIQQSDLRMINGYNPLVSKTYKDSIFAPLQSLNMGWVTADQIDLLRSLAVEYVILHADMYPEKVSPFPVGHALDQLMAHPQLTLMSQEESLYVFHINEQPSLTRDAMSHMLDGVIFPSRRWEWESCSGEGGIVVADKEASAEAYWIGDHAASAGIPWRVTKAISLPPFEGMKWMVRLRGEGTMRVETRLDGAIVSTSDLEVGSAADWMWADIPVDGLSAYGRVDLWVGIVDGSIALDSTLLIRGEWPRQWPPEGLTLGASQFFHSGYVQDDETSVTFRSRRDGGVVLYGPRLPVPVGRYRLSMQIATNADEGQALGWLRVSVGGQQVVKQAPVIAGQPVEVPFHVTNNLPLVLHYHFNREADVTVRSFHVAQESKLD